MTATIFDGRAYAAKMEKDLKARVEALKAHGINPKLATIHVALGRSVKTKSPSDIYIKLKKEAAERIGINFEVYKIGYKRNLDYAVKIMKVVELDSHGMFIQLPITNSFRKYQERMIQAIPAHMDVDGMRVDSPFRSATVKAIFKIFDEAGLSGHMRVAVIGAKGEVGRRLVTELKKLGHDVYELELGDSLFDVIKYEVVVTATGRYRLLWGAYIRRDAVVVDVASPYPDVVFEQAIEKASFVTPVPGGVGPVTVACLMENLVEAAEKKLKAKKK